MDDQSESISAVTSIFSGCPPWIINNLHTSNEPRAALSYTLYVPCINLYLYLVCSQCIKLKNIQLRAEKVVSFTYYER